MWHLRPIRPLLAWGVACVLLLAEAAWTLSWQVQMADQGTATWTSLALDRQGQPHISRFDWGTQQLKYSRFDGQVWHSEVVDEVGSNTALVLDGQDRPHIGYLYYPYDPIRHTRYAHWDGTAWRIETVDTQGGGFTAIALDAQERPHLSYCDCRNQVLKYARFDGTTWRLETVDTGIGGYTSLQLDGQGRPHISYSGGRHLRYAHFDGTAWQLETVDDLGQFGVVESTSLVLDSVGRPHIAYGPKYARWDGSAWHLEVIPQGGGAVALKLDQAGRPLVSSYDINFTLFPPLALIKLARFNGLAWQVETVDSGGVAGYTSLGLDGQGRAHISYSGVAPDALKYARGEPLVRLELQLNQPNFHSGDTLSLAATVTPGSAPLTADAYVALALPGEGLLFLQDDGRFTPAVQPLVRSWPVCPVAPELFRYPFIGSEPPGPYTWLAAFTWPGTLTLIEPLSVAPFSVAP